MTKFSQTAVSVWLLLSLPVLLLPLVTVVVSLAPLLLLLLGSGVSLKIARSDWLSRSQCRPLIGHSLDTGHGGGRGLGDDGAPLAQAGLALQHSLKHLNMLKQDKVHILGSVCPTK